MSCTDCEDCDEVVTVTCDDDVTVVVDCDDITIITTCAQGPAGGGGGGGGAVDSVFTRTGNVVAANGDYTASQITNVASGGLTATNVQSAINQVQANALAFAVAL